VISEVKSEVKPVWKKIFERSEKRPLSGNIHLRTIEKAEVKERNWHMYQLLLPEQHKEVIKDRNKWSVLIIYSKDTPDYIKEMIPDMVKPSGTMETGESYETYITLCNQHCIVDSFKITKEEVEHKLIVFEREG